jgi:hypothetical protein
VQHDHAAAAVLRERLRAEGVSVASLARAAGRSLDRAGRILRQERPARPGELAHLARALDALVAARADAALSRLARRRGAR